MYLRARPSEPIHFIALIRTVTVSVIIRLTTSLFLAICDISKNNFTLDTFTSEEDRTPKQARLYFDHRKNNQELVPSSRICSVSILNANKTPLEIVLMYLYDLILGTIPEKMPRLLCSSCMRHNEGTKLFRKQQLTLLFADTASILFWRRAFSTVCYFFLLPYMFVWFQKAGPRRKLCQQKKEAREHLS